jgi:light-regulated signal transduction histidine kinase (bacteriophytochrome)
VAIDEGGATVDTGPLPTVPGDAGLLVQVFQNVIGNALKFRRPDVAPVVRIRARPDPDDAGAWRIDVEDNGVGIDPQYADRIFVIFTRLNRREDYPGSGIGLALAKKIVEYHGGRIGLGEHGPTPGATISFILPSTDRRVVAEAVEAPAGARREGP